MNSTKAGMAPLRWWYDARGLNMSPSSGARLGPYEIPAALGSGGRAEGRKGGHTRLDCSVVIDFSPDKQAIRSIDVRDSI